MKSGSRPKHTDGRDLSGVNRESSRRDSTRPETIVAEAVRHFFEHRRTSEAVDNSSRPRFDAGSRVETVPPPGRLFGESSAVRPPDSDDSSHSVHAHGAAGSSRIPTEPHPRVHVFHEHAHGTSRVQSHIPSAASRPSRHESRTSLEAPARMASYAPSRHTKHEAAAEHGARLRSVERASSEAATSHLDGLLARLSRGGREGSPEGGKQASESRAGRGQSEFVEGGNKNSTPGQTCDSSRTNELLQQLVDLVRKSPKGFLPTGAQYGAGVK